MLVCSIIYDMLCQFSALCEAAGINLVWLEITYDFIYELKSLHSK